MTTIRADLKQEPSASREAQQSFSQVCTAFRFYTLIWSQHLFWRLHRFMYHLWNETRGEWKSTRWGLKELSRTLFTSSVSPCRLSYTFFAPSFSHLSWNTSIMSIKEEVRIFKQGFNLSTFGKTYLLCLLCCILTFGFMVSCHETSFSCEVIFSYRNTRRATRAKLFNTISVAPAILFKQTMRMCPVPF